MSINAHYYLGVVIRFGKKIKRTQEKTLCSNNECIRSHYNNELERESNYCMLCGSPAKRKKIHFEEKTPQINLEDLFSKEELEEKDYDVVVSTTMEGGEENVFLSRVSNTNISFDRHSPPTNLTIDPDLLTKWITIFKDNNDVKRLLERLDSRFGKESYSVEVALTSDYR